MTTKKQPSYDAIRSILDAKVQPYKRDNIRARDWPQHLREAGFLLRSAKRRMDTGDTGGIKAQAFINRAAQVLEA